MALRVPVPTQWEHAHAMGPTALERALLSIAPSGVGKLPWANLRVDGLIGWGAVVARAHLQNPPAPDPAPNSRPWEHLGDLEALSEQLGAKLG